MERTIGELGRQYKALIKLGVVHTTVYGVDIQYRKRPNILVALHPIPQANDYLLLYDWSQSPAFRAKPRPTR